jgi:NADH-ubiquinone oxidoreductase chain 4
MLTLLLTIPLIGIFSLAPLQANSSHEKSRMKRIALGISLINFFVSIVMWAEFDSSTSEYQFTQEFLANQVTFCHLNIGVDGISLYFVLLTTFITPICILAN